MQISPGCSLTRSVRKSAADLLSFSPYRCQHEMHALGDDKTTYTGDRIWRESLWGMHTLFLK